jgi:hypothetical protein
MLSIGNLIGPAARPADPPTAIPPGASTMLTIRGPWHHGDCDGVSRRDFLRVGGLALGGLSLPQLLRAESTTGRTGSHKSVIMIFLAGGPPHQDMVDLKMDAPAEIRGEYRPIDTNVRGVQVCEYMPRLARVMDKMTIIRSIVGCKDEHTAYHCYTGFPESVGRRQGGRPALGSVVSYLQGPVDPSMPPFVGLSPPTREVRWGNPGMPGYLGLAHSPYTPFRGGESVDAASQGLALDRLDRRRSLLDQIDSVRRYTDLTGALDGMDAFRRSAFEILTSRRLRDALDVTREDPRLRAKYGIGDMKNETDGPPCCMDHFLMARRLVEAGARFVTVAFGRWDTHGNNFRSNRERIPKLDLALSALIEDLHARGLERDVAVVVWGEFGRTPLINKTAGRDHWPRVSMAMLAGGGWRHGQVIGSTDRDGGSARDRPVPIQTVHATIYHHLGIDPATAVPDRSNRPMYLLEDQEPIRELI